MRTRNRFSVAGLIGVALVLHAGASIVRGGAQGGGLGHAVVVTPGGVVWTWGYNAEAQLGDNTRTSRRIPAAVAGLGTVTAVAAGGSHSLALDSAGRIWAWGDNNFGAIGDGTTVDKLLPVQLALQNVAEIAAGANHSLALLSNGDLYVWGRNTDAQLGLGHTTQQNSPTFLMSGVSDIAGGGRHSVIVKTDGTAWAFGYNFNGQLGDGTTTLRSTPVQMSGVSSAVAVAAGSAHTLIRRSDDTVLAAGLNFYGQVGDGTTTQRTTAVSVAGLTGAVEVAAGDNHSFARLADGSVKAWGANSVASLGDGTTTMRTSPVSVTALPAVTSVGTGGTFGVALTAAGVVYTWGSNAYGEQGDGTINANALAPHAISGANFDWNVATPTLNVPSGTYFVNQTVSVTSVMAGVDMHYTTTGAEPTQADPAISSGGSINVQNSLVLKVKAWKASMPVSDTAVRDYVLKVNAPSVSPAGSQYTTPKTVTLSTTTSGASLYYTVDGSTPTTAATLYTAPITISTGTALKVVGAKAGWVDSTLSVATYSFNYGTLSAPTIDPSAGPFTSSVAVTMSSSQSGAVVRYTTNGTTPTTTSTAYTGQIALTTSGTVKAKAFHPDYTASAETARTYDVITATPTFSLALGTYAAGTTVVVATATPGASISYTVDGAAPTPSHPVLTSGDTVVVGNGTLKAMAWRAGQTNSATASVAYSVTGHLTSPRVEGGAYHTVAVRSDGAVFAWGRNAGRELADGTTTMRLQPVATGGVTGGTAISVGDGFTLARLLDGRVVGWGANGFSQLGDGTTTTPRNWPVAATGITSAVAIDAGADHALAVLADGTAVGWGRNSSGQVGDGTTTNRVSPTAATGLTNAVTVSAGNGFSLAVTADGTAWSWGANGNGQLGTGNTTARSIPGSVSGLTNVRAVAAGSYTSYFLLADGTVRSVGSNVGGIGPGGALGNGSSSGQSLTPVTVTGLTSVVQIAAGSAHGLALKADHTVWAWGNNGNAQVGNGATSDVTIPVQVGGLPPIAAVGAGATHSLALGLDGSVWAWGSNSQAQLGDGSQTTRLLPVQVTVPGSGWALPAPTLTALTPNGGSVGTSVTLTGTDFGATPSSSVVAFNGSVATPTAWSPTSITTPVPAGASSGPVTVTVGGQVSNAVAFTVTSPPTLTAVSPTAAPVSAAVTLTGTNFGASQGDSTVLLNGVAAAPTAWSSTSITAPVPAGATSGLVTVTVDGQVSNGLTFTVIPTPTLTALSPTSGGIGSTVTLTGTNFGTVQGGSVVAFNGAAATPTAWSSSSITAPVPAGATSGPVTVTVQAQVSNGIFFTVFPTPTLTAITPNTAPVGAGVTVTGTNFNATQGSSTVLFNGTSAAPSAWSATSITVPVPTGATTGPVTVNVGGQLSNALPFTVGQPTTTVSITDPFPGTTFNAPSSALISATATTTGPPIDRVEFYDGQLLIGTDSAPPYAVTWAAPLEGPHSLTAVAADQASATATSLPVTLTIAPAGATLGTLATPIITPPGGAYNTPQTVTMVAAVGATIYYSLDGAQPTASSPVYSAPLMLTDTAAVQAIAIQAGWTESAIAYAGFVVDSVPPTVVSTAPASAAQGVAIGAPITVSFSEPMAAGSITTSAIAVQTAGGAVVPATVWFDDATNSAVVQPAQPLSLAATYTVGVKGGVDPTAATDLMGNRVGVAVTWSFTTQSAVSPPTILTTSELHVRNSTLVTLSAEDRDPQELALTYAWTQVSGPPVVIRGATSPIPSFVTPDTDALLRFRATVSNGFSTAFAECDVYVRQFTTAFGIVAGPGEGHTSDLAATAPTLRHGYLLERLAQGLSIQLTSGTGTILQPTVDNPISILTHSGATTTDVTNLFTYSAATNTVDVSGASLDALKQSLGEGRAELSVSAPDSTGEYAHIVVPIERAVARIDGTTQVVQGTGSTAGGSVHLTDAAGAFRASATITSNGAFAIEDVPAGAYEMTLDTADGLSGWASVTVPASLPSGSVAVSIDARSTVGLEPRQWPCDAIFPATYEGRPTSCTEEFFVVVPRGTASLSVPIAAINPNHQPEFPPSQQCEGLASWGYPYNHGISSIRLYLDGQPLASRTMANCDIAGDTASAQIVSDMSLNVRALTRDRDVVIRGLRSFTVDFSPFLHYAPPATTIYGGLGTPVDWQPTPRLAITAITDRVGNSPLKLSEEVIGPTTVDKFMGVPFDNLGTFAGTGANDHRWRMRVNYSPANAQITAVRAFVVGPGLQELLAFDQSTAADGKLDLTNVRFPEWQPHVLWHAKYNRLSIVVEVDGVAPDRPATTVRGELGIGTDQGPRLVTALYDAGRIPGGTGRRFSGRDDARGGDGWGTERASTFLQSNPDIWFNDLSLEHGGYFSPHTFHRMGLSIDVRYFGAGGNANPLNGTGGDGDQGTYRHSVLLAAEGGDVPARGQIVQWIRENRIRMDALFGDPAVAFIFAGTATWNWNSLVLGRYLNGSDIRDPADNEPIGSWTPAGWLRRTGDHLSHAHIELKRKP